MLEGGEWSAARPSRTLPPGKTGYPLYRKLVGPQGRSGRAENLASTGISSPDRPARSQSLYRLSYSAHLLDMWKYKLRHRKLDIGFCLELLLVLPLFNPLNLELNPICYLLALLAHYFLHVSRIRVKSLTLRLLISYIYGAPILDVSRSHTTMQHSR